MHACMAVGGTRHQGCDDNRGRQQTAYAGGPMHMGVGDTRAQAARKMFGPRRGHKPAAQPFMHQELAVRPFPCVLGRVVRA